ncbi:MAG: class I SAM-dependent methyltransferase [Scytolyngbya sp. HA4215-MV1]|nr:class I SAM-dependent methyltransferase [Scytolyngbya sp. HA4215-MV1]
MSTKPGSISGKRTQQIFSRRILPKTEAIAAEAAQVEMVLRNLLYSMASLPNPVALSIDEKLEDYPKLKSLNSFGKQIVIRMMRSNPAFEGYKVDFKDHILKPHVLLLISTLCNTFDLMNTSPLTGLKVLEVGCGALSTYAAAKDAHDLLAQFYADHPPINSEILQMLGAQTIGIDPRANCKDTYRYQTSYKHRIVEFVDLENWLKTIEDKFDVITGFHVFNRSSFLYHYDSPEQISRFLKNLRKVISPQGLFYSSAPVLPISPENVELNHQIFGDAGFRPIYEGHYFILEPI